MRMATPAELKNSNLAKDLRWQPLTKARVVFKSFFWPIGNPPAQGRVPSRDEGGMREHGPRMEIPATGDGGASGDVVAGELRQAGK
jgi:hypothetical protein